MKQYLRPHIVVIASIVAALLAGGGAAVVANGLHRGERSAVVVLQAEHQATPALRNQAPEVEDQDEAAEEEDEADEVENEAAEVENPAQPPAPAPTVTTRTFNLVGGSATFRCTGNSISL